MRCKVGAALGRPRLSENHKKIKEKKSIQAPRKRKKSYNKHKRVRMAVLKMGYIKGVDREQIILFPDALEEYIAENNPVRVIDIFINNLDLEKAGFTNNTPAKEGRPGYDPKSLLKLYIYGYFNKIRTSRKLMTECARNIEVMWLLGKLTPDFRTIADFRKNNAPGLKNVFIAFVKVCVDLDLYEKELIAIDGSKFRAVNSKNKNLTKSKLENKLKRIEENLKNYLKELDEHDKEDDDNTEKISKEELQGKIAILEQRKEIYNNYLREMRAEKETQKSLTDPESRLMHNHNGGFEVSYNVQTAVDAGYHMIVDFQVTNNCNDYGLLHEGAKSAKEILETKTLEVVADNGYESNDDILTCLKSGIIPHVALKKDKIETEIIIPYEKAELTPEVINSSEAKNIEKCLNAGRLPEIYTNKNINIEIIEKAIDGGESNRYFIISETGETITCPEGNILNKVAYLKTKQKSRFVNKAACSKCRNKCTSAKYKQVDLKDGQKTLCLKKPNVIEQKVKLTITPDKNKLKQRKCIVEHPFGTIKRWYDGSYVLMKSKAKITGEMALLFLAYNLKRAINIVKVEKLIEQLA